MNTPHTVTLPVAVRNLLSDMRGDVNQGTLPACFALELTLHMMRLDQRAILELKDANAVAGWDAFCRNSTVEAGQRSSAHHYCDTALHILASTPGA